MEAQGDRLLFGPFELRTDSGELFRDGLPVKLQPQPVRLLELLVRRSGEVVSREEIQRHLWGDDTFVEFEQGLNFSIRKLRIALGDSASEPRFLETIPRRGYRFLVPVRTEPAGAPPETVEDHPSFARGRKLRWALAFLSIALVLLAPSPDRRTAGPEDPILAGKLSPRAFQAFTEGRFLARQGRTEDDRKQAQALLQEAMLLAPDFAPAYAVYARTRLDLSRPDSVEAAETAARKALALDPHVVEARLALADIELYIRFDWDRARSEIEHALALAPGDSQVHRVHAAYLATQGHLEEALAAARRAQLLDPYSAPATGDLAWYTFLARRYDEALDLVRRTLVLDPEEPWARGFLIDAALAAGEPGIALAQANAILATVSRNDGLPDPPARVDRLRDYWQSQVQRAIARARLRPISPAGLAIPVLHLGETERALQLLREASQKRYGSQLAFLAVDPRFDPLRQDPRFQEILRSLRLDSQGSASVRTSRELAVGTSSPDGRLRVVFGQAQSHEALGDWEGTCASRSPRATTTELVPR